MSARAIGRERSADVYLCISVKCVLEAERHRDFLILICLFCPPFFFLLHIFACETHVLFSLDFNLFASVLFSSVTILH